MNLFIVTNLLVLSFCFLQAIFVFFNANNSIQRKWGIFNITVALWSGGLLWVSLSKEPSDVFIAWRATYLAGLCVTITFYHLAYRFCDLNKSKILLAINILAIILALTVISKYFVSEIRILFDHVFYNIATPAYTFFILMVLFIVSLSFYEIVQFSKRTSGVRKIQALYFIYSFGLGWAGGITTFLPSWGIPIYPAWHFTICIYTAIMTYAIFRYHIMDINIAITRIGIFAVVYSLVLGIPFGVVILGKKYLIQIVGENWFWVPMLMVTVLATVGPFVFLYIQKKAEDRLLQEQRRYQATLRQASTGMGRIKDLKKLLQMIVYVLTNAIQIEHALIYIYDEGQKQYVLGASKRKSGKSKFIFMRSIEDSSPLVQYLLNTKSPVIFEEVKNKAQDDKDLQLTQIMQIISSLAGDLIIPIFIDRDLAAIIIMGKKVSGKVYSDDDLAVFGILANQTALAIENARFYEDIKLTNQQLFQAEKMATIGTMADGLSHQINNRFHALGFIAGDALDTIRLNQNDPMPDKMKGIMAELEHAFVRVQNNVVQGGEIVQGLLKYTRQGEAGFTAVDVEAVFKSALEMAQFKIKKDQLRIIRAYDPAGIPKIKGNFTQLQEVFFNLIDNGYDAMMQRKHEKNEPDYKPTLTVHVFKEDDYAQVIFEDNGIGVKEENMYKLFTPFFTTKFSGKKGTGLGLYVLKKIIEDNHNGKAEIVSKYMQGTQMKLRLPIAIG